MKKNDIKALHDKSITDLQVELEKQNVVLAKARLDKRAGKLSDVSLIHRTSHDIARIKTILKEKEILEQLKKLMSDIKETKSKSKPKAKPKVEVKKEKKK